MTKVEQHFQQVIADAHMSTEEARLFAMYLPKGLTEDDIDDYYSDWIICEMFNSDHVNRDCDHFVEQEYLNASIH